MVWIPHLYADDTQIYGFLGRTYDVHLGLIGKRVVRSGLPISVN